VRKARGIRLANLLSLPLLLLIWQLLALVLANRLFPSPLAVIAQTWTLATQGPLLADLAKTFYRAAAGFVVSMLLGTALGIALGRARVWDRLFSAWLMVGLNLPAIVVAIVVYIWLGLTDFALILAVVINKTPLLITTIRQGVRSFSPDYEELARTYAMRFPQRLRVVFLPQLMPFILAAARNGLALVWKIVLVFEVLGSDGGVGYRVSIYFQFFDITSILAYTMAFMLVVLALEYGLLQPVEQSVAMWQADRSQR
jgi:NitT/TauT family transport system permease protein